MKTRNKPTVIGQYIGKCCDSDVFNNNDMNLPKQLFENLFASDEYNRALQNGHYIGYLGHPEDPNCMDFKNACIVMKDCHIEDNGEIVGTFDLVDTPVGRIVKSLKDAGVNFGISIRGAGDVDSEGYVDPDTFVFRGFDLVTFPAYDDCIPEFREIAASSDVNKQKKYKRVCAAVEANLKDINSASAINIIKEQFKPGSDMDKKLDKRLSAIKSSKSVDVTAQKLAGMTQLYMNQVRKNRELEDKVVAAQMQAYNANKKKDRFVAAAKRIVSNQMFEADDEIDSLNEQLRSQKIANRKAIQATTGLRSAISRLESENKKLKADNLKYKQKIEASNKLMSQKEDAISELNEQLDKTVINANKQLSKVSSNRDAELKECQDRIAACEQLIAEYQQAFANMYANALGVNLTDIPITSATRVEDLQKIIASSTTSAGIRIPGHEIAPAIEDTNFYDMPDDDNAIVTT